MKYAILLSLIGIFLLGLAFINPFSHHKSTSMDQNEYVKRQIVDFQSKTKSKFVFSLQDLFDLKTTQNLIDPQYYVPTLSNHSIQAMRELIEYSKTCQNLIREKEMPKNLRKAWIWQRSVCEELKLNSQFFKKPPYIHPTGHSYVLLALKKGYALPHSVVGSFSHLLESQSISNLGYPISIVETQLGQLSHQQLRNILYEREIVPTSKVVYLIKEDSHLNLNTQYEAFSQTLFAQYLKQKNIHILDAFENCDLSSHALCWRINNLNSLWSNRFILLGTLFFILGLVTYVILWFRLKSHNHREKQFILQTMAHEIRTPLTSIQLELETFRSSFSDLSDQSQDSFLKICDQMQRLGKVVDRSHHFLSQDKCQFNVTEMKSINSWTESILSPFEDVLWSPLDQDSKLLTDPYWLEVCLKNIIENAFKHGKKPIRVHLKNSHQTVQFHVTDSGNEKLNFYEISKKFKTSSQRPGMGLGIPIVLQILKDLNGELNYEQNPTNTFSIKLRRI